MSESNEMELEAVRQEARRLDDAITRNEISIGEAGPMLLGHLRHMIEIDLEQLQVVVPMREWAVRCCIDDWAHEISPLNAWDDFIAGLDQFVREFASRTTNISVAVWFRQFYDARPIDWDILLKLAQLAATVTTAPREGANADYWVLESRHWDAWTVREAANVSEHKHNTIEYCLRQNGELFKRVVSWEEVDQRDGRGYLRYSEAGLSEVPMNENDAVLMDFEPNQHHSDEEGTTVDTDRDPSENLLFASKGAGLANRLFHLASQTDESGASQLTQAGLRLLHEGALAYLVYGPGSLGSCYQAVAAVAPVFLGTQAAQSGVGLIDGRMQAAWLGFTGDKGSVIAYFVSAEGDTKWDVESIMMPLKDLPDPWHSDICTAGNMPSGVAALLANAHAVPVWEIDGLGHTR